MAGSPSVRFGIPEGAENAWNKLASAGGSASDVDQVLRALHRVWAANSADPRAFDGWLSELGIDKKNVAQELMLRAKEDFNKFQNVKRAETERLVQGITSGPNARQFFFGLETYPLEFREIAFCTGLRSCTNENLVFLLTAIARENTDLINSWLSNAPPSAVMSHFLRYLKKRPNQNRARPAVSDRRADIDVNFLFELMSLPIQELRNRLHGLGHSDVTHLITLVEYLFPLLPDQRYGEFARRGLIYLTCLASPEHPIAENVTAVLKASKEPSDIGLLTFLTEKLTVGLLSDLADREDANHARLMAGALDALRHHHPDAISNLPSNVLAYARKSRNALLFLSAKAIDLKLGLMNEADFQKMILRVIRADKNGMAVWWIIGNPEFVKSIAIENLPARALAKLFDGLARNEPRLLMQLVRKTFEPGPPISSHVCDASVRALDQIGSSSADELFVDLVIRHPALWLGADHSNTREPAPSLLSRNIWSIAQRIQEERTWKLLFEVASEKVSTNSILSWLKSSPVKYEPLKKWILEFHVPNLFERGKASAKFVVDLEDLTSQALLIAALCSRVLNYTRSIQTIATEWPKAREGQKQKLASRASVGLRIASRAIGNNQPLQGKLDGLLNSIERWRVSDSPLIDQSITSVTNIKVPETGSSDAGIINTFFAGTRKAPHETSFVFAANPNLITVYLSSTDSSWPKPELVVEQITKSLVFFANLNQLAANSIQDLERNTKISFGIALRDGLDDIEETLAGYFTFRSILREMGFEQVEAELGRSVNQQDISSDIHKVFSNESQPGRSRISSLGLKVGPCIVGSSKVLRSGDKDDRD